MSFLDNLSNEAKVAYFALVLVILILVFYSVQTYNGEHLENTQYLYTSGASQRFFGSEFSSANQGDYTTGYNFQQPIEVQSEHLTSFDSEPDLWAVGQDLYAYKTGVTGQTLGLKVNRGGMGMQNITSEHMADDPYEKLLHQTVLAGGE
jgi:hypothetical protein